MPLKFFHVEVGYVDNEVIIPLHTFECQAEDAEHAAEQALDACAEDECVYKITEMEAGL